MSSETTQSHWDAARAQLGALNAADGNYAIEFVDSLLETARRLAASDVHLHPTAEGLELRFRLDGVLQRVETYAPGKSSDVVTRLKVLAGLLTYRRDVPQEGRIDREGCEVEMRVSTFPTLYGERAVVRLFAADEQYLYLPDLGLPTQVDAQLEQLLGETSGAIIFTGPAGSGKTTTIYACLRHQVQHSRGGRSIMSLEDPIEVAVPGVSQSQVNEAAGFTLTTGLRSLLRQDPEMIMVGEIRDRETAEIVFQAALTGQLVLTTFHAGSAAEAIGRLSDLGIEPYLLRSGVLAIVSQRLVRRLCSCAQPISDEQAKLGLNVGHARVSVGCAHCNHTGYRGRLVLAEMLVPDRDQLGQAILSRRDAATLERLAIQSGMVSRWQRACEAVEAGLTSPEEIRRVLGFADTSRRTLRDHRTLT